MSCEMSGELSKAFPQVVFVKVAPLFLFNFIIDKIMKRTLDGLQNLSVRIMTGESLVDLEYICDIVLLYKRLQQAQSVMDELIEVMPSFDTHLLCTAGM